VLSYIDDAAENTWVVDTAFGAFGYTNFELSSYWIANVKGDGGYSNFQGGEPSGDGIYVHVPRYSTYPYGWNDVRELWTWGFICESLDN